MPDIIEWPMFKGLFKYVSTLCSLKAHGISKSTCVLYFRGTKFHNNTGCFVLFFVLALSTFKLHARCRYCQVHKKLSGSKNATISLTVTPSNQPIKSRELKCRIRLHDDSSMLCGASRKPSCIAMGHNKVIQQKTPNDGMFLMSAVVWEVKFYKNLNNNSHVHICWQLLNTFCVRV